MSGGEIGILNVGAGDTKLVFDKDNPQDCIRAARIVRDMLKRGYALLVEVRKDANNRPVYQRAVDFDASTCEYIIADFDPVAAQAADAAEASREQEAEAAGASAPSGEESGTPAPPVRRNGRRRRVSAAKSRGVAVARSAGG